MRNYLVVLLRNLRREKLYAAINIAGLSLGIACCLILGLFLRSELTYDRHWDNHEHIYRLVNELTVNGSGDKFAVTSRMFGPMASADFPEIKAFVRFRLNSQNNPQPARVGDVVQYWEKFYFVDPNVFEVFRHDILYGDPETALRDPNTVAVSRKFAQAYFGDENPVGKTFTTDSGVPQKITLVFADLPANTHLKYDMLFSNTIPLLRDPDDATQRRQALFSVNVYTYLVMAPDFKPSDWQRINDEFYSRYMADFAKRMNGNWHSWLQNVKDQHLQTEVGYDLPTGNRIYLYGCTAVALFILIVACINYMNLATARAARRARSVGVRKILGASRQSLALQFIAEAVMFSLIALVLAVVIIELALTFTPINELMRNEVTFSLVEEPTLALWLVGLGLLIGVLSGAYPALYLSSWAPLTALTGKQSAGKGNLRLREALVLVQFTISAAVIACTLLMASQMRYVANKSLGFEKENRVVVTLRGLATVEKIPTLRTELAKNPRILGISNSTLVMGQQGPVNVMQVENASGAMEATQISHMPIGKDFIDVMGLKIRDGRDFSQRLLTDVGTNFIVNEALVRKMGWDDAIGKRLQAGGQMGRVIGVVQDFNFKSLHTLIEPFVMYPANEDYSNVNPAIRAFVSQLLVLKISGENVSDTLGYVEKVVRQADPAHPFEYTFLDDSLDKLYKSEQELMRLIGIFATVCIFIACLGLFGLAAFTTEQRTREIGTRKVLGATTAQIILLLAKRILVLVAVAAGLASVMSYFAIDEWLTGFAYRADINYLIFLFSAVVAAAVAFATVAMQSLRTARADPVQALRHVE